MIRLLLVCLLVVGCQSREPQDLSITPKPKPSVQNLSSEPFSNPVAAIDIDPDPNVVHVLLEAAPFTYQVGEQTITGYAYNGQVPGPTIYAEQGNRLVVEFTNSLSTPTTVHWHGLHVPIEMDGVTWQRDPVMAGGSYRYEFDLKQNGAYWYHPHFDTQRTLDLGLYGSIVIREPDRPEVDAELVMVLDNWLENESRDTVMSHSHIDGKVRQWTVNGLVEPVVTLAGGDIVRVQMINVSNGGFLSLSWPGMELIGRDQGLLPALEPVQNVVLGSGDRVEALWRIGEEGFEVYTSPYTVMGGDAYGTPQKIMAVEVESPAAQSPVPGFSFDEMLPTPDPGYADIIYVLQGNSATGHWLMNGETFPNVTIEEIALGDSAIIEVRNLSPSEHPFHLHGYGFEVLSVNDVPPVYRQMEDTFNLKIYETVRVRLVANNPGEWMVHCHILSHQGGGMMTVLRVE